MVAKIYFFEFNWYILLLIITIIGFTLIIIDYLSGLSYSKYQDVIAVAAVISAAAAAVQAYNLSGDGSNPDKDEEESKRRQAEKDKYESDIKVEEVLNENETLKARIEELESKLKESESNESPIQEESANNNLIESEISMLDPKSNIDNSTNVDFLSDNIIGLKSGLIPDIDLSTLKPVQLVGFSVLLLSLVLLFTLISISIYLLNAYFIDKYELDKKYPKFIGYVRLYREVSYYVFLFNIVLFISALILLIIIGFVFLFLI